MTDAWKPGTPIESNAYNWDGEPVHIGAAEPEHGPELKVVDLFCGCGGFSAGFELAGFRSVLGADIHPPSIKTYQRNHPGADVILGDMRKVSDSFLSDVVGSHTIDLVAAGVPCQGFSLSNRKRWDQDERNFLFREFIRVVRLLQPRAVLLENVSGLKSAAQGGFKRAIAEAIKNSGYSVSVRMLNAAEFGVPQRRNRVFFLGVRDTEPWWPAPTNGPRGSLPFWTVWDAIGDLPQLDSGEEADAYSCAPFTAYQAVMRGDQAVLFNHVAPTHPQDVIDRIKQTEPGKPMYPRFRQRIRLHPDHTSPTQISGGIRPQFQFGHPTQARGLTVRERCRIQSFPDRYYIEGGVVQGRVQTGNAVPPLLARAIGIEIGRMLRGEAPPPEVAEKELAQLGLF